MGRVSTGYPKWLPESGADRSGPESKGSRVESGTTIRVPPGVFHLLSHGTCHEREAPTQRWSRTVTVSLDFPCVDRTSVGPERDEVDESLLHLGRDLYACKGRRQDIFISREVSGTVGGRCP